MLKAASLGKKNKPAGLQNEDTKTQRWCKSESVNEYETQSGSVYG